MLRASSVLAESHGRGQPSELPDLIAALSSSIRELATELTGAQPTSRVGRHWRFGTKGSLAVVVEGAERGSWFDHEAGKGGDALGLVAHMRRCPMRDACAWGASWLGMDQSSGRGARGVRGSPSWGPTHPTRPTQRDGGGGGGVASTDTTSRTARFARQLWTEGLAPADTAVAVYLASRGLALPADAPLRFHPACPRGGERLPAMLALMTDPKTGEPCGVHRTFLAADGRGKAPGQAKMMAGNAGVVRLVPDEAVAGGLGIAEGIETALRVMQGFGWSPVWAATSAGSIARFPVLAGVEALTVFADGDEAGHYAAKACAKRWRGAGREVTVFLAPAGEDFDDSARRIA